MATTLANLETTVWAMLNDTNATLESRRWSKAVVDLYIEAAVQEAFRLRPDLRLADDGSLVQVDLSFVPDNLVQAIADFAAYRALMEDDADSGNAKKAQSFLESFRAYLGV